MTWLVAKVYDDGRVVPVRNACGARHADVLAGEMRDGMTDDECGEDWNYLPRRAQQIRGHRAAGSGNDGQATTTYTRRGEEIG